MTSKTSYFDAAIFKRSLRKTMPLWICYLVFWLFILPGDLISFVYQPEYYDSLSGRLCERILNFCTVGSILSALIGLLAAWLLFSWLFRANASYFYASLPVRREALFVSNFAVGFLMVMLGNFLTALTAYCITLLHGYPQFYACTCFFGTSMLAFTGFYGFAVLLAMIIGQAAAMPAVYVILNFTSSVIYYAVQYLLSDFVYGMSGRTGPAATFFYQLSPIFYIMTYGFSVFSPQTADGVEDLSRYCFSSWGYLASLAVAGIVFAALALLVFRRREMERSGDVIAVKPLRPVFLYCFTIGCAIVLCYVISSMQSSLFGAEAFRRTLLFLIIGAFLGYFIAQMMLQKTVAVFHGAKTWLRFGSACLVLVLGCTAARYDVLGLYSRVPDVDEISYIDLAYLGTAYDRSDIAAIRDFQTLAIERRKENETAGADGATSVFFTYYLKDGTALPYRYRLADNDAMRNDPDSLIRRYDAITNSASMVLSRCAIPEEFTPDKSAFVYCGIEDYSADLPKDASAPRYLSADEAYEFYTTCILPDLKDTELGKTHITSFSQETKMSDSASIYVSFFLTPTDAQIDQYVARQVAGGPGSFSNYYSFTITKDAVRSAAYLENLGYTFDQPLG